MRALRSALALVMLAVGLNAQAQYIKTAYNLSRISSYVNVSRISYETVNELRDSLVSLKDRYNSVDFIVDMTTAKGDCNVSTDILCDSLDGHFQRLAILVGPHTETGALKIAQELRHQKQAIIAGDIQDSSFVVDIELKAYEDYRTQWYDSLHVKNIVEKSAQRYVAENSERLRGKYPTAEALYKNFDENAEFMETLNAVAKENGIKQNDGAFYYSGFVLLAESRAEILRQMFPDEKAEYYKTQNLSIESAVKTAQNAMESGEYRRLLDKE